MFYNLYHIHLTISHLTEDIQTWFKSIVRSDSRFSVGLHEMFYFLLPARSVVDGCDAIQSNAFCMFGGIGGGVGRWAPCGWNPPSSSATYVSDI